MAVGRNEPCPCGSKKKYKHCCFNKKQEEKAAVGQQQKFEKAKSNVLMKLGDLMVSQEYRKELLKAENVYFALKESMQEISDLEKLEFYSWFAQDFLMEDHTYFVDHFCREKLKYLDEVEKIIAKEMQNVSQKVYEILRVQAEGILCKEIYERKEVFIKDTATASGSQMGDLIAIRVIKVGEENQPIGIGKYIPKNYKESILKWIEAEYKRYKGNVPNASYDEFMRKSSVRFIYFFDRLYMQKNSTPSQKDFIIKEDEVMDLLKQNMKRPYLEKEIEEACNLWVIYKENQKEIKGKSNGFAGGMEYLINKKYNHGLSQVHIGEKYDVSASTIAKRYKELTDFLFT